MKRYEYTNENKNVDFYKELLKDYKIDTRRLNKFNLLSIYGALKCLEGVDYSKNLGIYILTNNGCVSNMVNAICNQSEIMPFSFLNIQANNASFYVAKFLETTGKNQVLNSSCVEFESALKLAKLDKKMRLIDEALIGFVNESTDGLIEKDDSLDISKWIYVKNLDSF